ncbi:serine hydrolase family protein, partial [Candidatus Gottesmanbacteria bacterium]|nr:serine hydrolase family protein [Candidatus Gottesmanbacteria bacterium]
MTFVIFHGAFGSPEENWFPQLREKLESLDQKVIVLQFPVDDWDELTKNGPKVPPQNQSLSSWLKTFKQIVMPNLFRHPHCFVAHSLGCVFVLHALEKFAVQLDSAIFVSPFLEKLKKAWQIDHANQSFYKTDFDFEKLKKLIPISYVLYSDNDPYVDKKYSQEFAGKLGGSPILVSKAGHMNAAVNLNEFPLVLELCKSRLDLNLHQKYMDHRRELFSVDYIKGKSEEVIYLDPKEVRDEGIFHFRNLTKSGFCTFFTGLDFWNTQSNYMEEARKAAKRVKNLTRVFIVEKPTDLKKSQLIKQIKLDLEAGIQVYLLPYRDLPKEV